MTADMRLDETIEKVTDALRACSDEELNRVSQGLTELLVDCLDRGSLSRPARAVGYIKDFVVRETNIRWAAIWHAEAEMQGGHRVGVTNHLNRRDAYNAICRPSLLDDAAFCWEGPDRATFEEAEADARQHHPEAPVVEDWRS